MGWAIPSADAETRAERVSETFARPFQRVQETRAEILRGEEDLGTFPVLGCVGDRRYAGLRGAPLGDPASDQGGNGQRIGEPNGGADVDSGGHCPTAGRSVLDHLTSCF